MDVQWMARKTGDLYERCEVMFAMPSSVTDRECGNGRHRIKNPYQDRASQAAMRLAPINWKHLITGTCMCT